MTHMFAAGVLTPGETLESARTLELTVEGTGNKSFHKDPVAFIFGVGGDA